MKPHKNQYFYQISYINQWDNIFLHVWLGIYQIHCSCNGRKHLRQFKHRNTAKIITSQFNPPPPRINRTHAFHRGSRIFLYLSVQTRNERNNTPEYWNLKKESGGFGCRTRWEVCVESRLFFWLSLENVLSRCAFSKAPDIYFYYTRRIPCNCSLWYLCQWCSFSQSRFGNAINFFLRNDED